MVVIERPATEEIFVTQLLLAFPSMCTVQALQLPTPQPYFVPFSLKWSRSTQSNGVSAVPSNLTVSLLIANEIISLSHPGK
jgi:hypothetical protein